MDESRALDVLNCELAQKRREERREEGSERRRLWLRSYLCAVTARPAACVCATFGQVENAKRHAGEKEVEEVVGT